MTTKDRKLRAIAAYADKYNLVPQLSPFPDVYFKNTDGNEIKVNMFNILCAYDKIKKEKKK